MDGDGDRAADGGSTSSGRVEGAVVEADPPAPVSVADLVGEAPFAGADGRPATSGWALLAVLGAAAAVLLAVVALADVPAIADEAWRDRATWASIGALGLLGLAVAAVAWTLSAAPSTATVTRFLSVLAVLGAFAGAIVVGSADQQGGSVVEGADAGAPSTTTVSAVDASDGQGEPPVGVTNAYEPSALTETATPISFRTQVTLQLNAVGRPLLAAQAQCRPSDYISRTVMATAIGGTWAEPLLIVPAPLRSNGEPVNRCRQVMIRLPVEAGIAVPFQPEPEPQAQVGAFP